MVVTALLAILTTVAPAPYGDDKDCRSASSTIRFETRTALPQGKPVTLEGEGGLSVTLTRR